ncbi:MAG: GatB/YqeY domain-containing protein [Alphaproteobacteria bacterium]|nr:GatB/YqeY domain-containing protein [Alphaproteobacteria bacterium]
MLREDLQNALKTAMLAKDTVTTSAVRMIIAGQKEKDVEARGKGAKEATDAELMAMMQGMIKQRNDSIKMYIDGNRPELAEKEKAEIAIIERFLPKQMTEDEIETVIKDIIVEVGASSMKDMGKIMGVLKAKYAGQLDMGKANGIIKASLTGN